MEKDILLSPLSLENLKTFVKDAVKEAFAETQPTSLSTNLNIREDLVSRKELETLLGVCHSTISARVKDRTLKPIYVGRRQFFRLSELPQNLGKGEKK